MGRATMSYTDQDLADMVRPDKVHRKLYVDPDIYDLEMERIYRRIWLYIGHASQVPNVGDYFATKVARDQVIMVRGTDDKIKVLYNRCPHKGSMVLPEGNGNTRKFFRCPYHGWSFHLDGRMLNVPLKDGYEGTAFDTACSDFHMRSLARVENYRGFVFASMSADGPSLTEFLGGALSSIDNLCDRAPEGEVEVAGGVFRVWQQSNWKIFYENLHDTMHPMVTHESSVVAAREQYAQMEGPKPLALHVMDGNGEPYQFWESLELHAFDYGHGYMGGIFNPGSLQADPVMRDYFGVMKQAYGEARALEILGMNRHNTIIYGSGSPHTVFQQFRVIRPVAVDRTLIEIYTFRLKGAPKAIFERALLYANVINSPSSNVMPDDIELYNRVQLGNSNPHGGDWISLHRYCGSDIALPDGAKSTNGTSELPMRNQFKAWKRYMLAEGHA
jgi:phenylpropionate dioxygenase-like ring-hydroxylating dioxygenase large terminal subunit